MPSATAVQIVAIVNSFNRLDLLRLGFPTLIHALQGCGLPGAVVVFEAGSNDGSREWLADFAAQNRDAEIVVHQPKAGEDTSFSAGVNAACRVAAARFEGARFYFLFETDNWLADAMPLVTALDFLQNGPREVGAVGFTVRGHDGPGPGFGCRFPRPLDFVVGPELAQFFGWDKPKIEWRAFGNCKWSYSDVVFTSPLLVQRGDWELIGGLDARAFPFSDCDLDLAWRMAKRGRKMAVLQSGGVVHDNRAQASAWSATRTLHFHRARYRLLRRMDGGGVGMLRPFLATRHALECVALGLAAAKISNPRAKLAKRFDLLRRAFAAYR